MPLLELFHMRGASAAEYFPGNARKSVYAGEEFLASF